MGFIHAERFDAEDCSSFDRNWGFTRFGYETMSRIAIRRSFFNDGQIQRMCCDRARLVSSCKTEVHCFNHRLNLALTKAFEIREKQNAMDLIGETFLSTLRVRVLRFSALIKCLIDEDREACSAAVSIPVEYS